MSSELDFGFGSLSLNEAKPLKITVPNESKGLIIGKGGETIKSIMARTRTKITTRGRSDSTFTITGSSEQAIKSAKAEIDAIVASFKKSKAKETTSRNANNNTYQAKSTIKDKRFRGQLPNSWLTNPLPGKLIDDFLLPIKCPLHENFAEEVKAQNGELFELDDVWKLEKVYKKHIGLIIDSTKTNRYYDWKKVTERNTKHKKMPLEVPDNLTEMPDELNQLVDYIKVFRKEHPDELVAIHCSKTNRCGLIIVSYLCRVRGLPLADALRQFRDNSDGVGIYRQVFIDKLHDVYGLPDEPIPICPDKPSWVAD